MTQIEWPVSYKNGTKCNLVVHGKDEEICCFAKKKEHTKNISDLRFRFCCYNTDLIGGYYKVARQEFIV